MNAYLQQVLTILQQCKVDLTNEKRTQQQLHQALTTEHCSFVREHHLDEKNIPDLYDSENGVTIEVKIKGRKKDIYKQLVRYSEFDSVKTLILCSNKALGLPTEINRKTLYFIHLGKAWL